MNIDRNFIILGAAVITSLSTGYILGSMYPCKKFNTI